MITVSKKIGIASWILTCMYFVVEPFFIMASVAPYSVMNHAMSDLGVTTCGEYTYAIAPHEICSPYHLGMNILFVVNGLTFAIGVIYLSQQIKMTRRNMIATICILILALGHVVSGFIPADIDLFWHSIFAWLGMITVLVGLWMYAKLQIRGKWWTYLALFILIFIFILIILIVFAPLPAGLLQRLFYGVIFIWGTGLSFILSNKASV